MNSPLPTDRLLERVRSRFYPAGPADRTFHRDRRMLLYALTWPAQWMASRGLPMAPPAYEKLLAQRLDDIAAHGDPQAYQPYFPRYLLKCLQDWFRHHGDDLYEDLKRVRSQLDGVDRLLAALQNRAPENIVAPLAQAHAALKGQTRRKTAPKDGRQLDLFPPP